MYREENKLLTTNEYNQVFYKRSDNESMCLSEEKQNGNSGDPRGMDGESHHRGHVPTDFHYISLLFLLLVTMNIYCF